VSNVFVFNAQLCSMRDVVVYVPPFFNEEYNLYSVIRDELSSLDMLRIENIYVLGYKSAQGAALEFDSEKFFHEISKSRIHSLGASLVNYNYAFDGGCLRFEGDIDNIKKILSLGVLSIANKRSLITSFSESYHFVKPSGRHSPKFIRAANVFEVSSERSFLALSAIYYGLDLNGVKKLLVDTSTISVFAYSCLYEFLGCSGGQAFVDSFKSYSGLEGFEFDSLSREDLVLVSASTSLGILEKIGSDLFSAKRKILFYVGGDISADKEDSVIFNLSDMGERYGVKGFEPFDSYSETECSLCLSGGSYPINLSNDQFLIEAPKEDVRQIYGKYATKSMKDFMGVAVKKNALACFNNGVSGFNVSNNFFVDIEKMLKSDHFKSLIEAKVKRSFPVMANLIVYCKDRGAKEFAEYVGSIVSEKVPNIEVCSLNEIDCKNNESVKGIVVVAASTESGRALLGVSRQLRCFTSTPINYYIGVFKFSSYEQKMKIVKDLEYCDDDFGFHPVQSIMQIQLPVADPDISWWDDELELLRELVSGVNDSDVVSLFKDRMRLLQGEESSQLTTNIFWPSPADNDLKVRPHFAFWGADINQKESANQAAVLWTVANVLQSMREKGDKDMPPPPLEKGYINKRISCLCFDRFNDGAIQAAILRSVKPGELDYKRMTDYRESEKMREILTYIAKRHKDPEGEALVEFLIAILVGSLVLRDSDINDFVNEVKKEVNDFPPLIHVFLDAIQQRVVENMVGETAPF